MLSSRIQSCQIMSTLPEYVFEPHIRQNMSHLQIIIIIIIIIQHLFMRHISSHCDHSEAHYRLKQLHIIKNTMIKIPNVKITR